MRLLLCPLFAVAAVLALTADSPLSELGNLTATAILGWYAWHTSTKTIPQLVDDFRGELAAERTQQRADREAFLHEMAEERMQRHADNLAVVQAMDHLASLVAGPEASARGAQSRTQCHLLSHWRNTVKRSNTVKPDVAIGASNVANLGTLSELLDLLAKLSKLSDPLNTAEGLRSAIDLLLRLGDLAGLDADWLAWLKGALENPPVFNLVLAIVSYLLSMLEPTQPAPSTNDRGPSSGTPITAQAIPISVWLTLIAEAVQLLQRLRAKQ